MVLKTKVNIDIYKYNLFQNNHIFFIIIETILKYI